MSHEPVQSASMPLPHLLNSMANLRMASGGGDDDGCSVAAATQGGGEADEQPSLEQLPRELLALLIANHMLEGSDVKRLSLTSRFFFSLVRSPEIVAAWLWQRHGNEALLLAMFRNDTAVFRQLVEAQRIDVNAFADGENNGLLHAASKEGRLEFVTYLLSVPGIQLNVREAFGRTPLHYACGRGQQAIVHELLQHPAVDVNIKDNQGYNALYWASHFNMAEVVKELLGHPRIDVNQGCPKSRTSLHLACMHCHASVVRELLKHPAVRVNQRDVWNGKEGFSALQWCLFIAEADEAARLATLNELLKHPGLDRGDMKKALQQAQPFRWLRRCAQAIEDALRT